MKLQTVSLVINLMAASCVAFTQASAIQNGDSFPRNYGHGAASPGLVRQCSYNEDVPLEERIHIFDGVPPALERAAKKVVSALLDNDVKSLRACCSKDGMIVVERSWDPDYKSSAGTLHLQQPHSDGMVPLDWVEQEEDIQPGEVTGYEFSRIFKQFHAIMVETYGGFDVSTGERDAWGKRFLGPVIATKWAAGAYLYFYFAKERGGWKVWRMEVATH